MEEEREGGGRGRRRAGVRGMRKGKERRGKERFRRGWRGEEERRRGVYTSIHS